MGGAQRSGYAIGVARIGAALIGLTSWQTLCAEESFAETHYVDNPRVVTAAAIEWSNSPTLGTRDTPPARPTRLRPMPFVDRSALVNVVREQDSLELWRLWSNTSARVYFGVGPTGFAGLIVSPLKRARKPKPRAPVRRDYTALIDELTAAASASTVARAEPTDAPLQTRRESP